MRQSATFTTRIDGKLVRTPKPLSQGKALILAREILGPSVTVYSDGDKFHIYMDLFPKFSDVSWERVLKQAEDSPEAKDWSDKRIAGATTLGGAINSLRAAAVEVLKKGVKHMTKKDVKFLMKGVRAHP